jgi:hypothetical protein
MQTVLANLTVYIFTMAFIKTSVLLFLRRLLTPASKTMRWCFWPTIFVLWASPIAVFFALVFGCRPLAASWSWKVGSKCLNNSAMMRVTGIVFALADLWLLILPIKTVWGLQMDIRSKCGMTILFSVGIVATAASFLKLYFTPKTYHSADPAWWSIKVIICDQLEACLGLIVACLPALNVFLVKLIPDVWRNGCEKIKKTTIFRKAVATEKVKPSPPVLTAGLGTEFHAEQVSSEKAEIRTEIYPSRTAW